MNKKEKQQTLMFMKLEAVDVWHVSLQNDWKFESIIKTAGNQSSNRWSSVRIL